MGRCDVVTSSIPWVRGAGHATSSLVENRLSANSLVGGGKEDQKVHSALTPDLELKTRKAFLLSFVRV
jgi:hypothetical protein